MGPLVGGYGVLAQSAAVIAFARDKRLFVDSRLTQALCRHWQLIAIMASTTPRLRSFRSTPTVRLSQYKGLQLCP